MIIEMQIGSGVGTSKLEMIYCPRIGEHLEFTFRNEKRRFVVLDVIHHITVNDQTMGHKSGIPPTVIFKECGFGF